jgi:hypothetical protein
MRTYEEISEILSNVSIEGNMETSVKLTKEEMLYFRKVREFEIIKEEAELNFDYAKEQYFGIKGFDVDGSPLF